jgi:hypothetical protein
MKTQAIYNEEIPEYALTYIFNDDTTGLREEDIATINNYLKQFNEIAKNYGGHIVISVTDEGSHFTWRPAFGLACDVVSCQVAVLSEGIN